MTGNDIEIYVRDQSVAQIQAWLHGVFGDFDWWHQGEAYGATIRWRGASIPVRLFPEAFRGFCCVLLESGETPWPNDLACARDARAALGTEIRCSHSTWTEQDDMEDEWWWRLDDRGEQKVRWN